MSSIQQQTDTTVHTDSSSSGSSGSSASSAASTYSAAQQNSSVKVQLVHAVTGARAAKLYKLELRTLERLLAVHGSVGQTSSVLLKLLKAPPGWRPTQEQQQQCDIIELKYDGNDFTQEGFECIIQYVYGGLVSGVTVGLLDTDKAAVALQAADFFGLTALRQATEQFAQRCGASLATDA
eukprot:5456-Heterococcus_DN1.PRE.4